MRMGHYSRLQSSFDEENSCVLKFFLVSPICMRKYDIVTSAGNRNLVTACGENIGSI